ncbi:MAG: ABC transporter permease [Deltaproteobacteria bacterium]
MPIELLLQTALLFATPILLAALGEVLVERAGILNIGLEGMMLAGAFGAAIAAEATGEAWVGIVAGALTGVAVAGLFAFASIFLLADQILVGTAVNLLALGTSGAVFRAMQSGSGGYFLLPPLDAIELPLLSRIPVLGPGLFTQNILVLLALLLVVVLSFVLNRTGLGLRIRALGDHPQAAASLGIAVARERTLIVLFAGALAGLGGACLALATATTFVEGLTAGRGFIALAVVVFGRWSPWGAFAGALLFGLASTMQYELQASSFEVPHQLALMLPYLATLAVLLLVRGRSREPRELAARYDRL